MRVCGEFGPGRLAEPQVVFEKIMAMLAGPAARPLAGRRAIVTAGPTAEPIDPVRVITNRSSGKQGFAIAAALAELGAEVTLVAGPVFQPTPAGVTRVDVETARQMLAACEAALPADIAVCVAAVSDWRPRDAAAAKIKKTGDAPPGIDLVENPDILATLSKSPSRPRLVIGFAAETHEVEAYAQGKLAKKGCDWIVANDVSPATGVMGGDRNTVHVLTRADADVAIDSVSVDSVSVDSWPVMTKDEVATALVAKIAATTGYPPV